MCVGMEGGIPLIRGKNIFMCIEKRGGWPPSRTFVDFIYPAMNEAQRKCDFENIDLVPHRKTTKTPPSPENELAINMKIFAFYLFGSSAAFPRHKVDVFPPHRNLQHGKI